jgi:hypothetical protein
VAFCEKSAMKGEPGKKELLTVDSQTLSQLRRLQESFNSLSEMLEDNTLVSLEFCELFQQSASSCLLFHLNLGTLGLTAQLVSS